MIGQCKFCSMENDMACFYGGIMICEDSGCNSFMPRETLLESEIVEWMQFVEKQKLGTAKVIIESKRKYIKHDDNCILVEEENGDRHVIPIDDDYLDYATDMLDEFIGDADYNELAIGDKITFTFIRMSDDNYKKLCEESDEE